MSEMVERVARALCVAAGEFPDTATPYNGNVDFLWQHYIPSARAEAMREPTKRMIEAGDDAKENCIDRGWDSRMDQPETSVDSDLPAIVFRAMTSAALEDEL